MTTFIGIAAIVVTVAVVVYVCWYFEQNSKEV